MSTSIDYPTEVCEECEEDLSRFNFEADYCPHCGHEL